MPNKPPAKSPAPFLTEDAEAAFKHFAPRVFHLPEADLEPWNADPDIVRVNATRGVDAVRPHLDHLADALPRVKLHELLEMPALALALGFAANRVLVPASKQEIRARQARLRPARSLGLRMLEILAELGHVSAERVKNIRANSGPIDEAHDAVAIVAAFRELPAAVAGRHPFDGAFLQQLADDGNWLLKQLRPTSATPEKAARSADAVTRDRLWTELVRRHDELYKCGVEIWGRRGVDAHVPALQSRVAAPSATQPASPSPASPPGGVS